MHVCMYLFRKWKKRTCKIFTFSCKFIDILVSGGQWGTWTENRFGYKVGLLTLHCETLRKRRKQEQVGRREEQNGQQGQFVGSGLEAISPEE